MKSNAFFDTAAPLYGVNKLAVNIIKPANIDDTFHKHNPEIGRSESYEVIPWRQPSPQELRDGMPNFTDMKFGRATVLGVQVDRTAKKMRWVLRCACGTYMLRTSKAMRKDFKADTFACYDCISLARLKRHDYVRRTGKEADAEDFL